MRLAENFYKKNIDEYKNKNYQLKNKINIASWSRLIIVLLTILIDYILFLRNKNILIFISTVILALIFIIIVIYHNNIINERNKNNLFIKINEKGIKRISGCFTEFKDNGIEYLDSKHSFIDDLDVFGNKSIFQYINDTVTKGGREKLVSILKNDSPLNKNQILERQEVIKELSTKSLWRQKLAVEGKLKKSKNGNVDNLINWCKKNDSSTPLKIAISCTFILVTIISIYLAVINVIPKSFILLDLMVNFIVIKIMSKSMGDELNTFESIKNDFYCYSKILSLIESEKFNSPYLKKLQKQLNNNTSCKEEMKKLTSILDWIGNSSYNAYYLILNITLFLDVFLLRSMEKWRARNGEKLLEWLEVMYEIDALSSISNLAFENENWVFPEISDDEHIIAVNIGHPLLTEKAVKNNFSIVNEEKVALITGSNMSGKSTFLRTLGLNLLLSYIGAPVYADKFSCGVMNIYTCMRTKDNLEENISSFYAEILRIKILIEACKKKEKVFFLLDEIFKGTNSKDRHIGATVLIKQLIKYGGIGLVSTHDLELCDLENENKEILNYNFREFYEENKIKFDYTLRKGKSTTHNAIHLMKLAGIDI